MAPKNDVRFTLNNGQRQTAPGGPVRARGGHSIQHKRRASPFMAGTRAPSSSPVHIDDRSSHCLPSSSAAPSKYRRIELMVD
jgi:hypothetical protein